jgi:hypothetical protein
MAQIEGLLAFYPEHVAFEAEPLEAGTSQETPRQPGAPRHPLSETGPG